VVEFCVCTWCFDLIGLRQLVWSLLLVCCLILEAIHRVRVMVIVLVGAKTRVSNHERVIVGQAHIKNAMGRAARRKHAS